MNISQIPEQAESPIESARRAFIAGLLRRKEQKIINAIGAYLGKETLSAEELMALKPRLRCSITPDKAEHYHVDDHHLITFQEPTFTMEGNVMTCHQAYGPVSVDGDAQ